MPRLQGPYLGGDAEQLAEEILEMRREIDQEIALGLAIDRFRIGATRYQPVVQGRVGRGEMRDKGAVEPDQPGALEKVGKREPVLQGEIGHAGVLKHASRYAPSGKSPRQEHHRVPAQAG